MARSFEPTHDKIGYARVNFLACLLIRQKAGAVQVGILDVNLRGFTIATGCLRLFHAVSNTGILAVFERSLCDASGRVGVLYDIRSATIVVLVIDDSDVWVLAEV